MTILVSGGAGYIGSHTVRRLVADGRRVVVIDSLERGFRGAIPGVELVQASIADAHVVADVCAAHGVEQVVHFAAFKDVGESMRAPGRYWHNNVDNTVTFVETLLANGVDQLVFSSSCSVNGTPDRVPVTEDAPIHPESVYAATKAMVEQILGFYDTTSGVRSVCLRYFNAAGASTDGRFGEHWEHSQNLIPVAMKAMMGRRPPLQVFGDDYPTPDGTCVRDYIHVDDLADAHVKALDHLAAGNPSSVLNVGTGTGSSVLDVLDACATITGVEVPHAFAPRRAGDPAATYADPTLIHQTLGWRAELGLAEIIESAWLWHQSHPDGYADD